MFHNNEFIACDDGRYGLEIYRVINIDEENEIYAIENFRGEVTHLSFHSPYYLNCEIAITLKEDFYKEKILEYKTMVRLWENF